MNVYLSRALTSGQYLRVKPVDCYPLTSHLVFMLPHARRIFARNRSLLDDTWPPSHQWECVLQEKKIQGPVVRKMDSTIRLINLYLEDSAIVYRILIHWIEIYPMGQKMKLFEYHRWRITPHFWREISALICNFTCEITKLPWQPFRTSQCQDGDEVLKCREWRCQGTKRRFEPYVEGLPVK